MEYIRAIGSNEGDKNLFNYIRLNVSSLQVKLHCLSLYVV